MEIIACDGLRDSWDADESICLHLMKQGLAYESV